MCLSAALARKGILARITPHTRLVLHLDVTRAQVDKTVSAFKQFFAA